METFINILIFLCIILIIYIFITFITAYVFIEQLIHPYSLPFNESIELQIQRKRFNHEEFNAFNYEDFIIYNKNNEALTCSYLKPDFPLIKDNQQRAIILCHGWNVNRFSMLAFANIYLNLGFHIFIYDHRNHFTSYKKEVTMGEFEADDLQDVIEYVKQKFNYQVIVGTHGESMGASCVMNNAAKYHQVDFVIEDCGYSSLKELLKYQCKYLRHFPTFPTLLFASIIYKLRSKSSFKELNIAEKLNLVDDIPFLFIHGCEDRFVPTYMSYQCFNNKSGYKKIVLFEHSKHVRCIVDEKEKYQQEIIKFLQENSML